MCMLIWKLQSLGRSIISKFQGLANSPLSLPCTMIMVVRKGTRLWFLLPTLLLNLIKSLKPLGLKCLIFTIRICISIFSQFLSATWISCNSDKCTHIVQLKKVIPIKESWAKSNFKTTQALNLHFLTTTKNTGITPMITFSPCICLSTGSLICTQTHPLFSGFCITEVEEQI